MNHPLVQLALQVVMLFGACKFLSRFELGWWALVLLVVLSAAAVAVTYLLRFDPARLQPFAETPGVRQFIERIALWAKLQPPAGAVASASVVAGAGSPTRAADPGSAPRAPQRAKSKPGESRSADFAMHKPDEFEVARSRVRSVVRGHDAASDQILSHLEQALLLRLCQEKPAGLPPLGAFLVAGPAGVGKRHLATAIGQLLYAAKNMTVVDLADFDGGDGIQSAFSSSPENPGQVFAAVKAKPCQTIVLQNIDRANAKGIELLTMLLGSGVLAEGRTGAPVSFQNCTFFLTTTKGLDLLQAARDKRSSHEQFFGEVRDALATDTAINEPLLSRLTDVVVLDAPSPWVKAEVIALLMERESRKYGVRLDYIDPAILAGEVAKIADAHGFEPVPGRVSSLLREPLYKASLKKVKRLILQPEAPEMTESEEAPQLHRSVAGAAYAAAGVSTDLDSEGHES